ncbi:MAG: hypothetical protein V1645_04350 [archaeon]|jgi:hypothetical protein
MTAEDKNYGARIFSEGMYVEKESTLYLSKSKTKEEITPENKPRLFSIHINEIAKVEKRNWFGKIAFLEIKKGIRARQTLGGGLEFKVDPGPGLTFELFNLSKEEYKILKNYTALQK